MLPDGRRSLLSNGNDVDEIRAKGMLRITALAEWLNSDVRPDGEMVQRRLKTYAKDYMMSEEEVSEILSDAAMAVKAGKKGADYIKQGKPSFSSKAGKYMQYLKNLTPQEYESVQREIGLSKDAQVSVLDNEFNNNEYSPEQREKVIVAGKRPNYTAKENMKGDLGRVF